MVSFLVDISALISLQCFDAVCLVIESASGLHRTCSNYPKSFLLGVSGPA